MKAAIYMGKEDIEIREIPTPECGDDDVLIKNIYSSICGTDVAVYLHGPNTGHRITTGGEFGHETVSRVAAYRTSLVINNPPILTDYHVITW